MYPHFAFFKSRCSRKKKSLFCRGDWNWLTVIQFKKFVLENKQKFFCATASTEDSSQTTQTINMSADNAQHDTDDEHHDTGDEPHDTDNKHNTTGY